MKLNDLKGLYIAHRGIQNDSTIENTLPAFKLALNQNVPIELDVHILKDGNIIVYHDNNLKRLMKLNKKISDYTYNELKKLTFPNTDIYIPLLEEVLELINGKVMVVIEIKTSGVYYKDYCKKIVSVLERYSGDFVIQSFDIRIVRWFLFNTDYITGLLIIKRKRSFYDWVMRKGIVVDKLAPHFVSVDYQIVSKKFVQKFRKEKPVLVWTIRNIEILDKVKKLADSYLIEKFYF